MKKGIFYFVLIFVCSCAQVTSLNLRKHQFGRIPTKIVWIQVAGLSTEHMAMLKFSGPVSDELSAVENSLCTGSTWEYNLYKIRPRPHENFLTELNGKKNIKNTCEDFQFRPIWSYLAPKGYKIGILEDETREDESLLRSLSCKERENYLSQTTFWKVSKKIGKNQSFFHVNDVESFGRGKIYYDKSCNSGECFTTFSRNITSTFSSFAKNAKNYLYIARNFNYLSYLKKKKFKQARAELAEINSALAFFQELAKQDNDLLVLLTTSGVQELNFPKKGKEWREFENKSKMIKATNSKLLGNVYASGARAENFCGIYDQSSILTRIFSGAKQQGLEFSIINPFD